EWPNLEGPARPGLSLFLCYRQVPNKAVGAVSFFARRLRYFFRRQRVTLGGRIASNAPPPFHMRSWWTVPLLASRAVWLRPLSADKKSCATMCRHFGRLG